MNQYRLECVGMYGIQQVDLIPECVHRVTFNVIKDSTVVKQVEITFDFDGYDGNNSESYSIHIDRS